MIDHQKETPVTFQPTKSDAPDAQPESTAHALARWHAWRESKPQPRRAVEPLPDHRRRNRLLSVAAVAVAVVTILLLTGCAAVPFLPDAKPEAPAATTADPSPTEEDVDTTESSAPNDEAEIEKDDIVLTVKIKSRKCYDYNYSADYCDVEWKIDAAVDRTGWPDEGEVDVTYEVRGLNGGPEQNTLTMDLVEGTFEQESDEYGEVRSRKTKVTAKVLDVEYSEY